MVTGLAAGSGVAGARVIWVLGAGGGVTGALVVAWALGVATGAGVAVCGLGVTTTVGDGAGDSRQAPMTGRSNINTANSDTRGTGRKTAGAIRL